MSQRTASSSDVSERIAYCMVRYKIARSGRGRTIVRESARPLSQTSTAMRIDEMNWMMVEEQLKREDRCIVPLGSTQQHAYLSLSVDSILAERLANEAGESLGIPVFPVLAYGITPYF